MSYRDFATKTQTIPKCNRTVEGCYPVGIDYGFSAVKGFAPNKAFTFPNCAYKIPGSEYNPLAESSDTDIVVKDENGYWAVGELAMAMMADNKSMNYEAEMFGRNRYFSPSFQALIKAGIAFCIMGNQMPGWNGTDRIVIQTGLPPKYLKSDKGDLQEAIAGTYDFSIKIGKNDFQHCFFTVTEKDIMVMDQPMGSLISALTDKNGMTVKDRKCFLSQKTLVFDPGFKTLDIYDIASNIINSEPQTFDNLGMHEVLKRTAEELNETYHINLSVQDMQNALRKGYIRVFNRRKMTTERHPFEDVLERKCRDVCRDAIEKVKSIYDYLQYHDNLIVTGGTGNAWYGTIYNSLSGMETLKIVGANSNDEALSNVYSNVRGYYFYLVKYLIAEAKTKKE